MRAQSRLFAPKRRRKTITEYFLETARLRPAYPLGALRLGRNRRTADYFFKPSGRLLSPKAMLEPNTAAATADSMSLAR
jgi:hypothetical protein